MAPFGAIALVAVLVGAHFIPGSVRKSFYAGLPPLPEAEESLDGDPVDPQQLVDVAIYWDGVALGCDSGVVTAADGWLFFQGTQCEFCVLIRDCLDVAYFKRPSELFPSITPPQDFPVCLVVDHHRRIAITPRVDPMDWEKAVRTLWSMVWDCKSVPQSRDGVRVYPPDQPGPDAYLLAWLRKWEYVEFAAAGLLVSLLVLSFASVRNYFEDQLGSGFGPVAGTVVGVSLAILARGQWRAWQAKRTLDRLRTSTDRST
jgi:hypothetical protein